MKDTEEKGQVIQQRLKAVSDRHKSYDDLKRKDIKYEVRGETKSKIHWPL